VGDGDKGFRKGLRAEELCEWPASQRFSSIGGFGREELKFKDLATQSIEGFSFSRKGIPRITVCAPIGAIKKILCNKRLAIEIDVETKPVHDKTVLPSASNARGPSHGLMARPSCEAKDESIRQIADPESINAGVVNDDAGKETDT
jgi:hypothetical protein